MSHVKFYQYFNSNNGITQKHMSVHSNEKVNEICFFFLASVLHHSIVSPHSINWCLSIYMIRDSRYMKLKFSLVYSLWNKVANPVPSSSVYNWRTRIEYRIFAEFDFHSQPISHWICASDSLNNRCRHFVHHSLSSLPLSDTLRESQSI